MEIEIKHFEGKVPQFNVLLSMRPGETFLEIKGCRILSGQKGEFISWPATKNEKTGKYWNHVYGSEAFNNAVMAKARRQAPKPKITVQDFNDDDLPPF